MSMLMVYGYGIMGQVMGLLTYSQILMQCTYHRGMKKKTQLSMSKFMVNGDGNRAGIMVFIYRSVSLCTLQFSVDFL